ncbi:syncytin-2-like [Xyrauchen texanus]|uniref:syncytin-2-like n=1 Tax=Xyrauchen texanus TaxID=154827 RepID=UPI00224212E4|nr:syncytin-2-like [Xyrauchen texanus]
MAFEYLKSHKAIRDACKAACATVHVPDEEGTGVLENVYWQCGYAIYVSLPINWTGTCALVQLHGGAMVIQHQPHEVMKPKKRGLLNIVQDSPVPRNHHIWNIAEKLLAAFVPGIGVASVMEEVQVTRYELISFIDTTNIMMEGIKEELRGLRLTVLQNRLVLDQLTASQAGVCVIVGETCRTYIPDNDAKGHVIEEGIHHLTFMSKTLTDRETNSFSFGWGRFKGCSAYFTRDYSSSSSDPDFYINTLEDNVSNLYNGACDV